MATKNFFRDQSNVDESFFDEGPSIRFSSVLTSSIDTTEIDKYRQGVELTDFKHYGKGMVKIFSGEPAHVISPITLGLRKHTVTGSAFQDTDFFNPVVFLSGQQHNSFLDLNVFTFPITVFDGDRTDPTVADGALEPFVIRTKASFMSIDAPFEIHDVRGTLMAGNSDWSGGSDQTEQKTTTVRLYSSATAFLDAQDQTFCSASANGYINTDRQTVSGFLDQRLPRNVITGSSYTSDMINAISQLSGSTNDFLRSNERLMSAGWTYDTSDVGSDSITFGGMVY